MRGIVIASLMSLSCASSALRDDLQKLDDLVANARQSGLLPADGPSLVDSISPGSPVPADRAAEPDVRKLLEEPLDADAAVTIALLNGRALRAELRSLGVARARVLEAGKIPNPGVEVTLWEPTRDDRPVDVELAVEWDLKDAILAGIAASGASQEREAVRRKVAASVIRYGFDVRSAFYAYRAAERRWMLSARSLDAMTAARDAMQALDEAGNVTGLRRWTEEAAYEGARQRAADLEIDVFEKREALNVLMGLSGKGTTWTTAGGGRRVPERLDIPPDAAARAITANLELAAHRYRLDALATAEAHAQTRQWLPELEVQLHAEQDQDDWLYGVGVLTSLPLFDVAGGEAARAVAEGEVELERYHGAAIALRSAARTLVAQLETAHAKLLHLQGRLLPARERVAAEALLQYNAMQIDVFQLLVADRELLDARMAEARAIAAYWTADAAFQALLAGVAVTLSPVREDGPAPAEGPRGH